MSEAMHDPALTSAKTPVHLWIVGGLSLIWNFFGVFDYLATHLRWEFYLSQFSQEQLDYFHSFPDWVVSGWAFGVWGALAGSVALLMRRRWAVWAFALSLLGLLVSSIYTLGLTNGMEIMGSEAVVFSSVIWVIGIFLLVYSYLMAKRGVLI